MLDLFFDLFCKGEAVLCSRRDMILICEINKSSSIILAELSKICPYPQIFQHSTPASYLKFV